MTACPGEATLRRCLAEELPADEAGPIEAHLAECAKCRQRLEELAGVSTWPETWKTSPVPATASLALQQAMETLEIEGASSAYASARLALQPSERAGFLGKLRGIELRRVIGRGGMGIVYEGLDLALQRAVAVKVLSPHLLDDPQAKERFFREARAVAALSHEHVVAIYSIDHTETDRTPYLVLQYVPGESLAEILAREKTLPIDELARIGAQISRGLAAAHAVGLIHRDVKPANVLVEAKTGQVRLTDFGLAKAVGVESHRPPGLLAGTPAFMSPEQTRGLPLDPRSDQFSLGVLLYLAATGVFPFPGTTTLEIVTNIRQNSPRPLTQLPLDLPRWFVAIVDRLLAKEPRRRFPSAQAVAEALEQRTVPRTVGPWIALGLASVLLAGGVIWWLLQRP